MKLSILVPVFNEESTLQKVLNKIEKVNLGKVKKEIIIVDDSSTDGTKDILKKIEKKYKVIYHKRNYGKGRAIRTAIKHATGDVVIIQDADLEYEPEDYPFLIKPIIDGKAKVVYGARKRDAPISGISFYLGGNFLTIMANILYGLKIHDEATCYKVFRSDIIKNIPLNCTRFEFCPEITAKVAKRNIKIHEVPIRYYPRSVSEGKKIKWIDGLEGIWTLIKYKFTN